MPRVLFIEDEPRLVKTLPAVLEDRYKDLQVVGMTDIIEAMNRLKEEEFDVVLLDISMPPTEDMDSGEVEHGRLTGIAVAQSIKKIEPDISIVALTVVSDRAMKSKMLEADIQTIINKPAEIDEIAQALLKSGPSTRK
jgi:CheY-like chemotaxis protein